MSVRWIACAALAVALVLGGQAWVSAQSSGRYVSKETVVEFAADGASRRGATITVTRDVKLSATLPAREKGQTPITFAATSDKMTYTEAKSGNIAVLHTVQGVAPKVTMKDASGVSVLTGTTITIAQPGNGETFTLTVDGNVQFTSDANATRISCQRLEGKVTPQGVMQTMAARGNIEMQAARVNKDGDKENLHATAPLMDYVLESGQGVATMKAAGGAIPKISITYLEKGAAATPAEPDIWELSALSWIRYNLATGDFAMDMDDDTSGGSQ